MSQNLLAIEYMGNEFKNAIEMAGAPDLVGTVESLRLSYGVTRDHQKFLKSHDLLSPDHFDDQYRAQKKLRRMYDGWTHGKKAFAAQFGSVSEKLESFDRKFEPNEGWKVFVDHFR